MKTALILPSTVKLTIKRRGTVCKMSYYEAFDPKACKVSRRDLIKAGDNSVIVMRKIMAESPELKGLRMVRVSPLSVRVQGTCHMTIAGRFVAGEFAGWEDPEAHAEAHRLMLKHMTPDMLSKNLSAVANVDGVTVVEHGTPSAPVPAALGEMVPISGDEEIRAWFTPKPEPKP